MTKRNDAAEVQRRAARRDPRQLKLVGGIGYQPKPRKPRKPAVPNGIDEARMAYLEGLAAFVEGHERASPYVGTPLTKDWLRGYERAEEICPDEDEIREELRDDAGFRDEIRDEARRASRRRRLPQRDQKQTAENSTCGRTSRSDEAR